MKRKSKSSGAITLVEVLTLFAIFAIVIAIAVGGIKTKPTRLPDVTLPNGEVVEAYGFMQGGRYHTIYTSKGKTVTSDNYISGKHSQSDANIESE